MIIEQIVSIIINDSILIQRDMMIKTGNSAEIKQPEQHFYHLSPFIIGSKKRELADGPVNLQNPMRRNQINHIGRLSSASNYRSSNEYTQSPQASTLMIGASRGSMPGQILIKRITSAYSSNNRPRPGNVQNSHMNHQKEFYTNNATSILSTKMRT